MSTATTPSDRQARITAARESFSGRTLTESQFREAWAISGILHGEIHKSGSFREKLTDYAHAYARSEKFDALRGEAVLRDVYQGRYGQSMNRTREGLIAAETELPPPARERALRCAESVGPMIREGETRPFYQAYDAAAVTLAGEFAITQSAAKSLMKETYQAAHGRDLYEVGKEIEKACHLPVREAEKAAREASKQKARTGQRSMV